MGCFLCLCSGSVGFLLCQCDDDARACRKMHAIDDVARFCMRICFTERINCSVIGRQWPNRCGEYNFSFASAHIGMRQGCRTLSELSCWRVYVVPYRYLGLLTVDVIGWGFLIGRR